MTVALQPSSQLAHARHELRTPIGAMIGYSEMIMEEAAALTLDLMADLSTFHQKSRGLLDQVQDILNVQRLNEGGVNLKQIGDEARTKLLPRAEELLFRGGQMLARGAGTEALQDLQRIGAACRLFREMLDRELTFEPSASQSPTLQPPPVPLPSEEAAPLDLPESEDIASTTFTGNVLIVDDVAFNREMLARGLWRQKHHFAVAASGKQALEMLRDGSFDLVLLDLMMPEMDGFEVLARIKADTRLGHIPVIMISALDQMAGIVRCIQMGAEDYLPKPFDPILLEARVGACLEKKRLRDLELEYLRNVNEVTQAAAAVETGGFDPAQIESVARRTDSLGQLARVFQSMAREVRAREDRLKMEVQQLKVEIDEVRKAKQVEEITETDYFQHLQEKADVLRRRARK